MKTFIIALLSGVMAFAASAANMDPTVYPGAVTSVSDCYSVYTASNGNFRMTATVQFAPFTDTVHNQNFVSRGFVIMGYNESGQIVMIRNANQVNLVSLDNSVGNNTTMYGDHTVFYGTTGSWTSNGKEGASYRLIAEIPTSTLPGFTAFTLVAGNRTNKLLQSDGYQLGANLYFRMDKTGVQTTCEKIDDPTTPPPAPDPDVNVKFSAPDWALGEIPPGDSDKTFISPKDFLCMNLDNAPKGLLMIKASNENGLSGNLYQLLTADKKGSIPYSLTLNADDNKTFEFPSASGNEIQLPKGDSCLYAVFHLKPGARPVAGDYSDTLSWDIVAKP